MLVGREVKYDKRLDEVVVCHVFKRSDRARAVSSIFIEIPKAPADEGFVGHLQLSLYGTRDAARNWAHEYTTFLLRLGFQVVRASPCNFTHRTRRVHLTVHGDDFAVVASAKQIAWLGEAMKKRYELKMEVLGPNAGQTEEVRVLNRIIRCWTRRGLEYEPDQRHAERIISELELETCKSV